MVAYTVFGLIVGPKMPAVGMVLGKVGIRRRRAHERLRGDPSRVYTTAETDEEVRDAVDFVDVRPAETRVESSWIVECVVDAPSAEVALAHVEEHLLPPVLASLETVGGHVYRFETVNVVDAKGRTETPRTSEMAREGAAGTLPLYDQRDAQQVAQVAVTDRVARVCAELLAEAADLHDAAGRKTSILKPALLATFEVIERVSQEVASHLPPPGDERRQKVIIKALRRRLKRADRLRNRVSLVKRASDDLDYAAGSTTRSRLLHSARVLGLDVETGEDAVELLRVRNRKLGHAGRVATVEELEKWLGVDKGRGIAIAYWSAYIDWIEAGRPSSHE
jgi:hypothetical protein